MAWTVSLEMADTRSTMQLISSLAADCCSEHDHTQTNPKGAFIPRESKWPRLSPRNNCIGCGA
ncbi:hypothetical protein [Desulfolutivibrio sp.]|uniref:hypothetical protein n=1 Tax=Desulfolutivibrio sp. TaxID=2773296 RepID=UPI002F96B675